MAFFVKDVLYPGIAVPPGAGPLNISRDLVEHCKNRMVEMIAAGLNIPVAWEHQDKAKPMTRAEIDQHKAELTKLTLGHATEASLHPEGFLMASLDIPNDEDAKRIPANRFISPEITWDFQDGSGKIWPGASITHLAVTPRPVQHIQKPFRQVSMSTVRLSLTDYAQEHTVHHSQLTDEDHRLGKDAGAQAATGRNPPTWAVDEGKWEEAKKAAEKSYSKSDQFFWAAVSHIYQKMGGKIHGHSTKLSLGDKEMAEEKDGEKKEPEKKEAPKTKEKEGEPEKEGLKDAAGMLKKIKECLHELNIVLGDDVTLENLLERLYVGLETKIAHENPHPTEEEHMAQVPAGVTMSLANKLLKMERQELQRRLDALHSSGRIGRPLKDKLAAELNTVKLSLTDAGDLGNNAVLSKIEAYEALDEGTHPTIDFSLEREAKHKYAVGPPTSKEEVDKAVNGFFELLPGHGARRG